MSENFFRKIFKRRRSDVSIMIYGYILLKLVIIKVIYIFQNKKIKKKSCLIIFPPSLGLGDLIMLSKIVDLVNNSKKYSLVKAAHLAPYLQKNHVSSKFLNLNNWTEILCYETFIKFIYFDNFKM